MMKKLLVLTLVLGIASLATAGTDLATVANVDYSVSDQTVSISVDADIIGFLLNLKTDDGSQPTNIVFASGFTTTDDGYWESTTNALEDISASKGSAATFQGFIISFDVGTGVESIDFVKDIYNADSAISWNPSGSTTLTGYTMTIPEPATMALLGLGGLFLARRKK